ncbi:MAG: hypothetical protein KDJ45_01295 [Hyphomicrobiaceae bacterium]|nr:hypothetical protein [Hyphomicrobiaceae bacterium]MCC0010982.1 hypothetical protein [Hyphomicrobiaceae bacterium]
MSLKSRLNGSAILLALALMGVTTTAQPAKAFFCFSFSIGGGPRISFFSPGGFGGPWSGPFVNYPVAGYGGYPGFNNGFPGFIYPGSGLAPPTAGIPGYGYGVASPWQNPQRSSLGGWPASSAWGTPWTGLPTYSQFAPSPYGAMLQPGLGRLW